MKEETVKINSTVYYIINKTNKTCQSRPRFFKKKKNLTIKSQSNQCH